MANVQHSELTGADLHECKGAASAASGQVPVANGSGSAPFGFLAYSTLTGKPTVPVVTLNNAGLPTTPRVQLYTTTASSGLWSISISGLTTLHGIQASVISGGTAIGTAAVATVAAATTSAASGSVVVLGTSGNTLGDSQTVNVVVWGI